MKKLFLIIIAIVLVLSACVSEQEIEEPITEQPKEEPAEISPKTTIKEYDNVKIETTKNPDGTKTVKVLDFDGNQIGNDYTFIKRAVNPQNGERFVCYFIATTEPKPCSVIDYDKDGNAYVKEDESKRYVLLDEFGVPVVDIEFEQYWIYGAPQKNEFNNNSRIDGTADGYMYSFEKTENGFEMFYKDGFWEEDLGNGFIKTTRIFANNDTYYGLKKDGRTVLEPVYGDVHIKNDRIYTLERTNYYGNIGWKEQIYDFDLNLLAEYHEIFWMPFGEKGEVYCAIVDNNLWGTPVFDENGNEREEGVFFIDEDGKIISDIFDAKILETGNWESGETVITYYIEGEEKTIDITPYIIKH